MREGFVGLDLIFPQGIAEGSRPRFQGVEDIGVQPRDVDGVGLHEAQVQGIGCRLAMGFGKAGVAFGVEADVQHRARPAPIGVGGAGADGDQGAVTEMVKDSNGIHSLPRRDGADAGGRKRHGFRHRKVKPDQSLQALGPPAMTCRRDHRARRDLGKFGDGIDFLHCGTLGSDAA